MTVCTFYERVKHFRDMATNSKTNIKTTETQFVIEILIIVAIVVFTLMPSAAVTIISFCCSFEIVLHQRVHPKMLLKFSRKRLCMEPESHQFIFWTT